MSNSVVFITTQARVSSEKLVDLTVTLMGLPGYRVFSERVDGQAGTGTDVIVVLNEMVTSRLNLARIVSMHGCEIRPDFEIRDVKVSIMNNPVRAFGRLQSALHE